MRHCPEVKKVLKAGSVFWEYKNKLYPDRLNKGNAIEGVKDFALTYCKGTGLDIGSGRYPLPGAVPIQDYLGRNAYDLRDFEDESLDYVFSSHCLEHLERPDEAIKLWTSKLKLGGILFLYLPHESMELWRPGAPWVGDQHKWIPTFETVFTMMENNGLTIIDNSDIDYMWSWNIVGEKCE